MTEQIEYLFNQIYSEETSDEDRQEATNLLFELYKNPSTILALFAIIENTESNMRRSAAVNLRLCLNSFFENEEIDPNDKEVVKQNILNLLSAETELLTAKNLIESCEKLFEKEVEEWADLFSFIENNHQTPIGLQITLYLIANVVRYFRKGFAEENFQLFQEIAQQGIESQDQETMILSCEMLGAVISYISPEGIGAWEGQQNFLMEYFVNCLSQQADYDTINRVIYSLADSFQSDVLALPAQSILQNLIQLLEEPQMPKERYGSIFTVIQYLLKEHAFEFADDVESILKAVLYYGAEVYDENDYSDTILIASTAGDFAGELKMPRFLKVLQTLVPSESNDSTDVSYALTLLNSIDECEEEVANDIKPVVEIIIQFLNSQNFIVKDIGAQLAVIIGDSLEPSQLDIATTLIPNLLPLIQSGNMLFTKSVFCAIISLLTQGLNQSDMVPQILETLLPVLDEEGMSDYHDMAIEAISSLIFAIGEDILPYANQILPIIIKGTSLPQGDPNLENIKKQAIIALGMLLRFGRQSVQDNIQEAVELILSNTDIQDIEMNHAVLLALGNLVIAHLDILVNYREKIIETIDGATGFLFNHILTNEDFVANPDREAVDFNNAIQGFTDTFSIMKWIFKSYNELSPDSPAEWMIMILQFMQPELKFPELQKLAIVAGFYGTVMCFRLHPDLEQPTKYFDLLIQLFHSEDPSVVGKCFSAFKYFVKEKVFQPDGPFDTRYLEEALGTALSAMKGKLDFQAQNSNFDFHSSKHLFKFLKELFKAYPNNFPLEQYVSSFKSIVKDNRQLFEMSHYIGVINYIYNNVHSELASLTKKMLIKYMIDSFARFATTFTEEDIDYSAFSVPPSPLGSMCLLRKFDEDSIKDSYSSILELINVILNYDFNGERFYNATISNAIEFLLVDFELNSESFDLANWYPLILQKLPLKLMGDEKLSNHIYSVILMTMSNDEVIQHFGNEILRVFVQALGAKDRLFNRFRFTRETIGSMIEAVKNFLSQSDQDQESLKGFFSDEQSYLRFCSRMEAFSSEE